MSDGVLHDLMDGATDPAQSDLDAARALVQQCIDVAPGDPVVHLNPEAMRAFRAIREHDALEYESARTAMKQANRLVRMEALDQFSRDPNEAGGAPEPLADRLAELAAGRCELWHNEDGEAFASFERNADGRTHREHWRVDSRGFGEWLSFLAYREIGRAPSREALSSACSALAGQAQFDGEEYAPALRVAKNGAGYWIDLCDSRWRAIHITPAGWAVVDRPPVRFVRTKAMRPLPEPAPAGAGNAGLLWPLVNIPEGDRPLVLAFMLEAMRPDTPYPALELAGEQGSAKSTTQETLRRLLDPNDVMLRGRPKSVEDVFVAAGANHIISFENLSGITAELSDAFCTISTGGGQAGRQLFTNGEEHIIRAHNPVMLNGIGAVVTRPDLLDRAVTVCLPTITERMTEAEHAAALERDAPAILGGLLDLMVQTLTMLPGVEIAPADRPRMADFAMLGEAMHRAMGNPAGEWLALYVAHRQDAIRRTVDSSPVAQACIEFCEDGNRHAGTVKALLETLNARSAAKSIERSDYWPRSPKGLGDALRRAAPALRQIGIHLSIESKPRRDGVHCELRAAPVTPFPARVNIEAPSSPTSHIHTQRQQVTV